MQNKLPLLALVVMVAFIGLTISDSSAEYVCGDANGDLMVNVGDAVFLINYIFSGGAGPVPNESGDANCDGEINVAECKIWIT